MDFGPVIEFIGKHEKFILCGHESPDGDAIGSVYAMCRALTKIKKTALIFNADPTPPTFSFVDRTNDINVLENEEQLPEDLTDYVLMILDTNDIHNIGSLQKLVLPRVKDYLIIDHHDAEINTDAHLICKEASSTSEILYYLFKAMKIRIDIGMAEALFMAIVYDTGSFIYPKTTDITFKAAYDLVKKGVNPNKIYTHVYETNSIPSIVLQSRVLATLELHLNRRVAVQTMTKNIILETGADYEEGRSFINLPLKARDIKVSIFFKESANGMMRCSLRSKENIDIGKIARDFGGGGHRTAAGFKCKETIEAVKDKVLKRLKEILSPMESMDSGKTE